MFSLLANRSPRLLKINILPTNSTIYNAPKRKVDFFYETKEYLLYIKMKMDHSELRVQEGFNEEVKV